MGIRFREDPDLVFLQFCDNEDLNILVKILVGQENGKRISQNLSKEFRFESCDGNYKLIWDLIAGELQLFGGDTVANKIRGHGVLYKEIITDCCDQVGEKCGQYDDVNELEIKLILGLLQQLLNKMSQKDCEEFCRIADIRSTSFEPSAVYSEYHRNLRQGGVEAIKSIYVIANVIAKKATGLGLPPGGLAAAGGALLAPLLIPVFNLVWAGIFAGFSITGPAYRVTVPACAVIAYMRRKYLFSDYL